MISLNNFSSSFHCKFSFFFSLLKSDKIFTKKCEWRGTTWQIACHHRSFWLGEDNPTKYSGWSVNGLTSITFVWHFGNQWPEDLKESLQVRLLRHFKFIKLSFKLFWFAFILIIFAHTGLLISDKRICSSHSWQYEKHCLLQLKCSCRICPRWKKEMNTLIISCLN